MAGAAGPRPLPPGRGDALFQSGPGLEPRRQLRHAERPGRPRPLAADRAGGGHWRLSADLALSRDAARHAASPCGWCWRVRSATRSTGSASARSSTFSTSMPAAITGRRSMSPTAPSCRRRPHPARQPRAVANQNQTRARRGMIRSGVCARRWAGRRGVGARRLLRHRSGKSGHRQAAPDEFQVVRRAPLMLPPDFNLRPPAAGRSRAGHAGHLGPGGGRS